MGSYAEDYFASLERLIGRTEDRRSRATEVPPADGMPPAYAVFYRDWPIPGVLSAFTLGAGVGRHVERANAHVELVVSLATGDMRWGLAAAYLVEDCRTHLEIDIGTTLDMSRPL